MSLFLQNMIFIKQSARKGAEHDLGYDSVFMDLEKENRAKQFANSLKSFLKE